MHLSKNQISNAFVVSNSCNDFLDFLPASIELTSGFLSILTWVFENILESLSDTCLEIKFLHKALATLNYASELCLRHRSWLILDYCLALLFLTLNSLGLYMARIALSIQLPKIKPTPFGNRIAMNSLLKFSFRKFFYFFRKRSLHADSGANLWHKQLFIVFFREAL